MEKEFIPYALALELKKLGFDEPCLAVIQGGCTLFVAGNDGDYNGNILDKYEFPSTTEPMFIPNTKPIQSNPLYEIKIPLYQQAFDWFREKHNLIGLITAQSDRCYDIQIRRERTLGNHRKIGLIDIVNGQYDNTYKEARQVCLEKLIEILKNK